MGTTSRGYPTPEGSDNVDIPGDLSALASAINTDVGSVDTAKVSTTRTITAGTGLTGGGDLSANRTLAVSYGTTAGTAAQGNDSRITGAVQSSLVDAKGDLLAGTADNTVARLAAPADGRVLVADSTQTAGWTSAAMGNVVPLNVANGGEDGTTTGWHQRSGQPIESTDAVPASVVQGTRAILLTKTTATSVAPLTGWNIAGTGFATSSVGTQLSVTPGETWTVFASLSSDTVTDSAVVALVWADASGTVLSRTTSTAVALSATPKRYGVTGIAPANAARLGIEIGRSSATALTTFRCLIDAVSVHRGAGGLWSPPGVPVPNLGTRANPDDATQVQVWNPGNNTWITV